MCACRGDAIAGSRYLRSLLFFIRPPNLNDVLLLTQAARLIVSEQQQQGLRQCHLHCMHVGPTYCQRALPSSRTRGSMISAALYFHGSLSSQGTRSWGSTATMGAQSCTQPSAFCISAWRSLSSTGGEWWLLVLVTSHISPRLETLGDLQMCMCAACIRSCALRAAGAGQFSPGSSWG